MPPTDLLLPFPGRLTQIPEPVGHFANFPLAQSINIVHFEWDDQYSHANFKG
jgi:hypothetical protein